MFDYEGIKCPVCNIPFKKDDDIVVCPTCGAPYHRHCYNQEGKCLFDELHEQGKSWEIPEAPQPPNFQSEIKDLECPVCGVLNAHSALFCNHCGTSLTGGPSQQFQNRKPYGEKSQATNVSSFGGMSPFMYDPMGGVSPTEQLDENVSFGDASKLVKTNTAYYMNVFHHIKKTGKSKFNFSAFFCNGPWLLYRKQYKSGAIITTLMFALHMAYIFLSIFITNPLVYSLMDQIGMDTNAVKAGSLYPSSSQIIEMCQIIVKEPVMYIKIAAPVLCLTIMFVIMILVGINANKMYMKHCVKIIQKIKLSVPAGDVGANIDEKGGVNLPIGICMLVCYMLISNIPLFFL